MSEYFTFVIALGTLVATAVSAVFGTISRLVRTVADFVLLFSTVGFAAFQTIDQAVLKRLAIVFALLVLFILILIVGPFGVSDSDFVQDAISQVYACFIRPAWELVNKAVLFTLSEVNEYLGDVYNNFIIYAYHRGQVAYAELTTTVACFELRDNAQYLFDIPAQAWTFLGSLGFGFLPAPRQNKLEPIPRGEYGYHYPLENFDSNAIRRFEFNPDYAAQGPAEPPTSTYPNVGYIIRDWWSQWSRIFEDVGKLVFGIFSKLARPTQQFFPSLYVAIESEESTWREASDLVCRVTEVTLFTYLWPYGKTTPPTNAFDARQEDRDEATQYLCRIYRVFAEILSVISLYINDILTLNRPIQINSQQCEAFPPTAAEAVERLLRGFPVVDFFIFPRLENNINIFRSSLAFCKFIVQIQGQSCLGLAAGSLSINPGPPVEFCPVWSGGTAPLTGERIDYLKVLLSPTFKLVSVLGNANQDVVFEATLNRVESLVARWLNFLITDFIFVINALGNPVTCQLPRTLNTWLGVNLPGVIIETIEFAYNDRCTLAVPNAADQNNIFLCFLAMASRSGPSTFWRGFCTFVDGIGELPPTDVLQMNCGFRKRQLGEAKKEPRPLTWYEHYRYYTPYYAYHLREASEAFDYCFTQKNTSMLVAPRCQSRCAIRPCVDAALDCVQDRLVATGKDKNSWIASLNENSYARSAAHAATFVADLWFGCKDGDMNGLFEAVNATIDTMRDFSARTAAATVVLMPTHSRCGEEAGWHDTTIYLKCTGLKPLGETWEETLKLNNIDSSTLCGAMLHVNGIVLHENTTAFTSAYDGCLMMFAYGANARAQGLTEEPLSSFLNGWTLPHAVSTSTENLKNIPNWNPHPRETAWWTDFMIDGPKEPRDARATDALADEDIFRIIHDFSSVAYAYFNYAADVYRDVIAKESTGEEKDRLTDELFATRVLTVVAAVGTQTSTVVESRAAVVRAAAAGPSVSTEDIFRMYGNSLIWVDRLHATPSNVIARSLMSRHDVAQLFDANAEGGALVEARVRQRFANGRGGHHARQLKTLFGIKVSENPCTVTALAPYYQDHPCNSTSLVKGDYPFAEVELEKIIDALIAYNDKRGPSDHIPGDEAISILTTINNRINEISADGYAIVPRIPKPVAYLGRVALRILWNIVNSRLRLDTLPAVQAAAVVKDVLTGGSSEELRDWMAGRRGYIVGVGYVAMDTYLQYMDKNEITRTVLANGVFSSPLLPEELGAMESTYARRRRLMRNLAIGRTFEKSSTTGEILSLPGSTDYERYIAKLKVRRRGRKLDYRHRAKFLVDNGLHDEVFVANVIPEHSHHYRFAQQIANGSTTAAERREFSAIVATDTDSNAFLFSVYDTLIATVIGGDTVASDARADLFDIIQTFFDELFLDIATFFTDIYEQLLVDGRCRGDEDFRIGGTGKYRFGCIPFWPERLFSWYRQFPAPLPPNPPYEGLFTWFTGPGYAVWPADMIKAGGDCVPERDPLQTPVQPKGITMFNSPTQFWSSFRLTNACEVPSLVSARPLCATLNCDFCPRLYKTAAEAGFTNGWINISVWFAALRELARISIGNGARDGFWYLTSLLLLTEFPQYLPVAANFIAAAVVIIMLFGATYIAQQPELFVFQYFVWLLFRLYGAGLAWIVYFVYAANLFPIVFLRQTDVLFGNLALDIIRYLSLDQLLQWVLIGLRAVFSPLLGGAFDLRAALTPIIDTLGARLDYIPPSVSEVIYSLFSLYNFVELILLVLGLGILAFVVALAAAFVLAFVADVVSALIAIVIAISFLASRIRLSNASQLSEQNEEDIDELEERVERIEKVAKSE
jgi:hypothetical protein